LPIRPTVNLVSPGASHLDGVCRRASIIQHRDVRHSSLPSQGGQLRSETSPFHQLLVTSNGFSGGRNMDDHMQQTPLLPRSGLCQSSYIVLVGSVAPYTRLYQQELLPETDCRYHSTSMHRGAVPASRETIVCPKCAATRSGARTFWNRRPGFFQLPLNIISG
jgi:hypothetical protein